MIKSHRIVFRKPNSIKIEEAKLPELSSGQILVKTLVTLISAGTEITALTGRFPPNSAWSRYVRYPFYPGYSNVGIVIDVGDSVRDIREGDRVASLAGHTEYAILNEKDVVKVPEGITDEEAAFHTIASGVMHSVRLANILLGDVVVIIGAGLLGQLATQFSRLSGAYPVIVIDLIRKRLELAKTSGATEIINPIEENVEDKIRDITKGRMADIVFEVTGEPTVIPWAIKLVRPQGRLIILSSPRGPTQLDFHDEVNAPSRIIMGTHFSSQPTYETPYYPWTRRRNIELFFELLTAGIIKTRHLITHIFPWYEAQKAYETLLKNKEEALGVILDFRK